MRVREWFTRHGHQVVMIALSALGVFLAARGALTVS
jgi:hypothetical protein